MIIYYLGGGFYLYNTNLTITKSKFNDFTAGEGSGGIVYSSANSNL